MAYKYTEDEVLRKAAEKNYQLSEADQRLAATNPDAVMSIIGYKDEYGAATTPEGKATAHAGAQQERARAGGYTGGEDGSKFHLDYTYAPAPSTPESPYTEMMQAATDKILDRDPFSYNAASDPSYQAYSEKYRNLGRNSMQNALGNAAAMTGGQLSSYALTAAQQANDAYNAQLSDVIPTLEQAAYQKYVSELNQNRNDLSMLQGLDNTWYGREQERYQNDVNKYQLDYSADRDKVADQRYDTEWQASEEQRAYANAIQQSETYGYVVSDEAAAILGVPKGTSTQSKAYQDAQVELQKQQLAFERQQAAASLSSGGGSSSRSSSSSGSAAGSGGGTQDYSALYQAAAQSGNPQAYIANNYKQYGFNTSTGLYNGYTETLKQPTSVKGLTMADAVGYLQKCIAVGRGQDYMYDAMRQIGYSDDDIQTAFALVGW